MSSIRMGALLPFKNEERKPFLKEGPSEDTSTPPRRGLFLLLRKVLLKRNSDGDEPLSRVERLLPASAKASAEQGDMNSKNTDRARAARSSGKFAIG